LYLKHLLRGVKLGLFDEATAMVKFQAWHEEHEANNARRSAANRRQVRDSRQAPVIKKVEAAAPAAEAPAPEAAPEAPAADAAAE